MKKVAVFCAVVTGFTALALGGCSSETFAERTYSSGEAEISSVTIDVEDREVQIGASGDGQVHIHCFESEKQFYEIGVSESGELSVTLLYQKEWSDFIGTKPAKEYRVLEVLLPDALTDLTVTTTNETLSVSNVAVSGSASLDCNGGDVSVQTLDAGKDVRLTVKNGNIAGTLVGGWDDYSISCTIKKGESNLPERKEGGAKALQVDCNNGDVSLTFLA